MYCAVSGWRSGPTCLHERRHDLLRQSLPHCASHFDDLDELVHEVWLEHVRIAEGPRDDERSQAEEIDVLVVLLHALGRL